MIPKGELSTGNPTTLVEFVAWARAQFPVAHTALIISDHVLDGTAVDDANGQDYLTMPDLRVAYQLIAQGGGKVDILFNAPALWPP